MKRQLRRRDTGFFSLTCVVYTLLLLSRISYAQTVSPVVAEYQEKAEGRVSFRNNTPFPMLVVVQARSFSITPDGIGIYRSLDPGIQVELSSMNFRIDPGQSHEVFYKAKAKGLPAWFTIYATFSAAGEIPGIDVRVALPHTVYVYPKKPKSKGDVVEVRQAAFFSETGKIVCEIANNTADLERVEEIRAASESRSITFPGFPLLPGAKRHLQLDWKETDPPREVVLHMHRSTLKLRLSSNHPTLP